MAKLAFAAAPVEESRLPAHPCLPAASHARIQWNSSTAAPLRDVRVYFHSANALTEHYIEMRRDAAGRYWAVLPKPNADTPYADYRIVTVDQKGQVTTQEKHRAAVSGDCAAPPLSADETKFGERLVVGSDVEGPSIPVGFRCDGIIGLITAAGNLRAYDACNEQALAMAGIRRQKNPIAQRTAIETLSTQGLPIGPTHHRTPRRAPLPPQPPNPRLSEPISPSHP